MDLVIIGDFISRVGFPIAVAAYLLWFQTTHVKHNTEAFNSLKEAIDRLINEIGGK